MKNLLRSCALAFSCFSRVPMPQVAWTEDALRTMLCFFPLVGVVIGVAEWVWLALCGALGFAPVLVGAGLALVPALVTGGIHLDGFCDVVDAQASHAEPARKREILKDSHVGAFAVIGVAGYLLMYAALGADATQLAGAPAHGAAALAAACVPACLLGCGHVQARCLSGLATAVFPKNAGRGMLAAFHDAAGKRAVPVTLAAEYVVFVGIACVLNREIGIVMAACGLVSLGALHRFARRQFGGMSGDLAGWFLQVAELAMLAGAVVCLHVMQGGL